MNSEMSTSTQNYVKCRLLIYHPLTMTCRTDREMCGQVLVKPTCDVRSEDLRLLERETRCVSTQDLTYLWRSHWYAILSVVLRILCTFSISERVSKWYSVFGRARLQGETIKTEKSGLYFVYLQHITSSSLSVNEELSPMPIPTHDLSISLCVTGGNGYAVSIS